MRGLNIGGALVVLLANLYVSFNHTLDLFRSAGFVGNQAVVATIGAEAGFLVGVVNLVVARFKGIRPSWPAKASGALGLFLVGWSNVAAGWPYGLVGVALGLYIPAMMFTTEANLGWSLSNKPTKEGGQTTTSKADQPTKTTNQDQPATKVVGREDKPTSKPTSATNGREDTNQATTNQATSKTSNVVDMADRKAKKTTTSTRGKADPRLVEKLKEFIEKEGRFPSEREFAIYADVSRYQARKAIKEYKAG